MTDRHHGLSHASRAPARVRPHPGRETTQRDNHPTSPPPHGPPRLTPHADPATGALCWHVTVPGQEGHPITLPPQITITIHSTGPGILRCRADHHPELGMLAVDITLWPGDATRTGPLARLPACGQLSVRDTRITTRMGRTIRYLIPEFTPGQKVS